MKQQLPGKLHRGEGVPMKVVAARISNLMQYLLSKWKVLLGVILLGAIGGLLYSVLVKPVYIAKTTFVLEEESKGGLGQYSGLASLVGIDLGGIQGSGIFEGDNIIDLYKSRKMIAKTLLTKADMGHGSELIINRYIALKKLREDWKDQPGLETISFSIPQQRFTVSHDSIINQMVEDINKKILTVEKADKKLSLISVLVKSEDKLFSKAFADAIVENVNSFYVKTKTKKTKFNLDVLTRQSDSVRAMLESSMSGVVNAIDANPNANYGIQRLKLASQKNQIDLQANSSIYAELRKNRELTQLALLKETPLIQVIDEPVLPLKKKWINKPMGMFIGAFVFFFIAVCTLIGRHYFITIMAEEEMGETNINAKYS